MQMCNHETLAIRVHRRTMFMIEPLDDSVTLEGNEDKFFMIYCVDSDHEEYETIDKETFDRTYGPMDDFVHMQSVNTID